jgi:protein-tyrosine kinase
MAKVYEALQRAEEERRRKIDGEVPPSIPLEWDPTPESAPTDKGPGLLGRLTSRSTPRVRPDDGASEVNKRRISMLQPDSFVAEQFRTLRGRIDSLATQRPIRTIAVTSANAGDGKSTSAINLSVVTSMSVGRRVLLIDCDLRRPKIHRSLGIEPKTGLAEILIGEATLDDALVSVEGLSLDVLPVRARPANPSELLAAPEMRTLIEDATGRYDQVILDTPACLGLPDAKAVTELCDGIVMVVRAGTTPASDVRGALEILDSGHILGLILNGAEVSRRQYGYY